MTPPANPAHDARLTFGRTVRELRAARGLTVRTLAELLRVSPATVSAIENGRTGVSSTRTALLAEVLEVPVQQMFGLTAIAEPTWRSFPPLDLDLALGGALSSFQEFGYHGATMRTIAQRAQLSVAGLYHYYPSKQDMLVALLDLTMTDLQIRSAAARAEGRDPVERFAFLVECLALVHTHRRALGFVGASEMRSLAPEARRRLAGLRREQQQLVDHEVEQAVRTGAFRTTRPREASRAVVTMCTALPYWFHDTGPTTAEQVAAQYVEFALDLVQWVDARAARAAHPTH